MTLIKSSPKLSRKLKKYAPVTVRFLAKYTLKSIPLVSQNNEAISLPVDELVFLRRSKSDFCPVFTVIFQYMTWDPKETGIYS